MFNIEIIWKKWEKFVWTIEAGQLNEDFIVYFENLRKKEILDLWNRSLQRLLNNEYSKTILATSVISWYIFHRRKSYVYITEHIFQTDILIPLLKGSYDFIPEKEINRKLTLEEIQEYRSQGIVFEIVPKLFSEWRINILSIEKYLSKI